MTDDWTTQTEGDHPLPDDAPAPDDGAWDDGAGWDDAAVWNDAEWDDVRAPMSTGRRVLIGVLVLLVVLAAALGAGWVWVQGQIDPSGPPGEDVELEISSGSTTEQIGTFLADEGVISSGTIWNYWTRLEDAGPFQAGIYVFQLNSSFDEAVRVLEAGPRPPQSERITIPEGLTVAEIVPRIADPTLGIARWSLAEVQAALDSGEIRSRFQPADQPSMEGLLFPNTYEVADETDERGFVQRLVNELDARLTALDVEGRGAALGRTPYEIVIIASLIEEEARVPEDRAKISRVIHNRLEQGIPLGIDATSRYEAEQAGRGRDRLDFSSDSPYNTRRQQGLPPTPIAAPGQASLEAALAPADGPWIFYVLADADGHHFFTESSREFQRAKQECIQKDLGCG